MAQFAPLARACIPSDLLACARRRAAAHAFRQSSPNLSRTLTRCEAARALLPSIFCDDLPDVTALLSSVRFPRANAIAILAGNKGDVPPSFFRSSCPSLKQSWFRVFLPVPLATAAMGHRPTGSPHGTPHALLDGRVDKVGAHAKRLRCNVGYRRPIRY